MMKKQQEMQLRLGERQRRMMVTQMLAQQRETFWWLSGAYGTILTGVVTFAKVKGSEISNPDLQLCLVTKKGVKYSGGVPKAVFGPLALYGVVIGYFWDMAYGTKMERINRMMNDILTKEKDEHWFAPLTPSDSDVTKIKKW